MRLCLYAFVYYSYVYSWADTKFVRVVVLLMFACMRVSLRRFMHGYHTHTSTTKYLRIAPVLMILTLHALWLLQPPPPVLYVLLLLPLRNQPVHLQQLLRRPPPVPVCECVCA